MTGLGAILSPGCFLMILSEALEIGDVQLTQRNSHTTHLLLSLFRAIHTTEGCQPRNFRSWSPDRGMTCHETRPSSDDRWFSFFHPHHDSPSIGSTCVFLPFAPLFLALVRWVGGGSIARFLVRRAIRRLYRRVTKSYINPLDALADIPFVPQVSLFLFKDTPSLSNTFLFVC